MINIKNNLDKIKMQIQQACQQSGRLIPLPELVKPLSKQSPKQPSPVSLLAVSKTKPSALIEQAHLAGQNNFGENSIIIETFTLDHGKCSGIVYGGSSRENKKIFQIGNKILINNKSTCFCKENNSY